MGPMIPAGAKPFPWGSVILGASVLAGRAMIYAAWKRRKPSLAAAKTSAPPPILPAGSKISAPKAPTPVTLPKASPPGSLALDPSPGGSSGPGDYDRGYAVGVKDGNAALAASAVSLSGDFDPNDYMTNYDSTESDGWRKGYKDGYRGVLGI